MGTQKGGGDDGGQMVDVGCTVGGAEEWRGVKRLCAGMGWAQSCVEGVSATEVDGGGGGEGRWRANLPYLLQISTEVMQMPFAQNPPFPQRTVGSFHMQDEEQHSPPLHSAPTASWQLTQQEEASSHSSPTCHDNGQMGGNWCR